MSKGILVAAGLVAGGLLVFALARNVRHEHGAKDATTATNEALPTSKRGPNSERDAVADFIKRTRERQAFLAKQFDAATLAKTRDCVASHAANIHAGNPAFPREAELVKQTLLENIALRLGDLDYLQPLPCASKRWARSIHAAHRLILGRTERSDVLTVSSRVLIATTNSDPIQLRAMFDLYRSYQPFTVIKTLKGPDTDRAAILLVSDAPTMEPRTSVSHDVLLMRGKTYLLALKDTGREIGGLRLLTAVNTPLELDGDNAVHVDPYRAEGLSTIGSVERMIASSNSGN